MHPFPGLSPRVSSEAFAELCRALPPPINASQAARDSRDMLAMAAVAAFRPADITEALMVVEIVAIEAHVRECLRLAGLHQADIKVSHQCRAQATAMMRQKQRALRMLHEYQAARPIEPAASVTQDEPVVETVPRTTPPPRPGWPQAVIVTHSIGLGLPVRDRAMARPPVDAGRLHLGREIPITRYA